VNRALQDVAFFKLNVDSLQASAQYSPSVALVYTTWMGLGCDLRHTTWIYSNHRSKPK